MLGSFGQRKRLFTLAGFPIYADMGAGLLALIVLSMGGSARGSLRLVEALVILLVIFGSIILHELGHAFSVRKLGYGQSTIVLSGMGGVTLWHGRPTRRDQIIVSLAGPMVSLGLAVIGYMGGSVVHAVGGIIPRMFFSYLAYLNLFWAVFNLLPIYPMDGGKAVRAWLEGIFRGRKGRRLSLQISGATAAVIVLIGVSQGYLFVAIYLGWIALKNWNEWQALTT